MDEPILKLHWERFQAHVDLDLHTAQTLLAPFTQDSIEQLHLLSEGCANTHYKVTFKNLSPPVVIRIYMREKEALQRELAIYHLIANHLPVAKYFYTDDRCTHYPYPYAIQEWIEGKLLRDWVVARHEPAIRTCLFEAGVYLNELRNIKFAQAGFFVVSPQQQLEVRPFSHEEEYLPYVLTLLQDQRVKESLQEQLHSAVYQLVTHHADSMLDETAANLAHSDYDPANILVVENRGTWKIAAILDWEFASAITYLLDVGLMLRYSHRLPLYFEQSFIAGLQATGATLPTHWKKQAKLMDLLCLLQFLHSHSISERPKTHRDVVSLIADIVSHWYSY